MKVVVIGAGAAGMMAAIVAAKDKNDVTILEKTKSAGNKLKITGKGRCNLTFDGDATTFENNILKSSKFMRSSFYKFNNHNVINFFNDLGIDTKIERGGRVFPVCDDAKQVVKAMLQKLNKLNVKIKYDSSVSHIQIQDNKLTGVVLKNGDVINCDKCILATGGKSYQVTGSNGDGYLIAQKAGHKIIDVVGGLVPLKCYGSICKELQGLSLKNISLNLIENNTKVLYNNFGELLFTHFGMSGPLILSASSKLNRIDNLKEKLSKKQVKAVIDLKPALDDNILDKRICRDFEKYTNKEFKNSLDDLLPQKLIPVIIKLSGIDPAIKVNQITKKQREKLVSLIKNFEIYIEDIMPIDYAIISCGGVDTKQIDPKTMESKIVKGLYFAGEIIDVDAYTGGFNLQIAFSTAYTAGKNK